jgi:hypothetical protein
MQLVLKVRNYGQLSKLLLKKTQQGDVGGKNNEIFMGSMKFSVTIIRDELRARLSTTFCIIVQ